MAYGDFKGFDEASWYAEADSLSTEHMFGVGGEIDPKYPDIQMFNFESGDYSTEYLDAVKGAGGNIDFTGKGTTPRDMHYSRLQSEAIGSAWGDNRSGGYHPDEGLMMDINKMYGDKPQFMGEEFVSPYSMHKMIRENMAADPATAGLSPVGFKQKQNEWLDIIPEYLTTDAPQGYIPFQGSN